MNDEHGSDPHAFSATWLLVPLALFVGSLFLPSFQGPKSGWTLFAASLTSYAGVPNYLYLLSLGLLSASGGRAALGRAGRIVGWLAALASLPPLLMTIWLVDFPGYWVWAGSLWIHAVVPYFTLLRLRPRKASRKSSLASEVAISAAISAAPAVGVLAVLSLLGVEPPQGSALLVPSQLAMAGSASLGAFVLVLAWRLRRRKLEVAVVEREAPRPREAARVAARWKRGVVRRRGSEISLGRARG